jgi:hypothetical protein
MARLGVARPGILERGRTQWIFFSRFQQRRRVEKTTDGKNLYIATKSSMFKIIWSLHVELINSQNTAIKVLTIHQWYGFSEQDRQKS